MFFVYSSSNGVRVVEHHNRDEAVAALSAIGRGECGQVIAECDSIRISADISVIQLAEFVAGQLKPNADVRKYNLAHVQVSVLRAAAEHYFTNSELMRSLREREEAEAVMKKAGGEQP